jgi:hypothetical protein
MIYYAYFDSLCGTTGVSRDSTIVCPTVSYRVLIMTIVLSTCLVYEFLKGLSTILLLNRGYQLYCTSITYWLTVLTMTTQCTDQQIEISYNL